MNYLKLLVVFVLCVGGAVLANNTTVEAPQEAVKTARWVVACETKPTDKNAKTVTDKAGTLTVDGAKCHKIGFTGTRDLYTCEGRDAVKMDLSDLGCVIYEYDGISKIDAKEATVKAALVRGSTCIGTATMTWGKRVKTYQIWPCAWNGTKPGFRVGKIDRYGPGVIGKGSLRQIVGLTTTSIDAGVVKIDASEKEIVKELEK